MFKFNTLIRNISLMTGLSLLLAIHCSVLAANTAATPPSPVAQDSVENRIDKANKDLSNQNYDQAIAELIKIVKQQQETIDQLKAQNITLPPAPGPNATKEEKESFLKQLTRSLPFVGAQYYEDVEGQWDKAYQLQHKAVFDLSRREAIPVFESAIKEYRVIVESYPHSKRAPQSQRQIAWIYTSQLKNYDQARVEWSKLIQNYPNCQYIGEARAALSNLGTGRK